MASKFSVNSRVLLAHDWKHKISALSISKTVGLLLTFAICVAQAPAPTSGPTPRPAPTATPGLAPTANGPLPPTPAGTPPFAGALPAHQFAPEAGNFQRRMLFSAAGPANTVITIQDVLVRPSTTAQLGALAGPAMLEPYFGEGTLIVGKNHYNLGATKTLVVPGSQPVSVVNPNTFPLNFRLYVFSEK